MESYLESFDVEPGYLNWASFGPLAPSVRADARADAQLLGTGRPTGIDLVAGRSDEARQLAAELLGAPVEQVTLQPSTTYGLMNATFGITGAVLVSRREFPSATVAVTRAAQARGKCRPHWIDPPDSLVTADAVREALTDDVAAVVVSLVDYRTGYRADLPALREVIGDRLLVVDATQGFGVVDADYRAADVVCAHGFKWLRAGRGTGFAWFGDRALERIAPVLSGISGTEQDAPFDDVPPVSRSARAFTVSTPDPLAAARLAAGLRDIRDVGVASVDDAVGDRIDAVIRLADRYDIPVATPRERSRRAGILSLLPSERDAGALSAALVNAGVTVTSRGGAVRVSAHAGTDEHSLRLLADAFAAFASSRVF